MSSVKFYFDENVELAVCEQLKRAGIDAISARELGLLSYPDELHLQKAFELGRVLCTYDTDFLVLAAEGNLHSGILFAPERSMLIGHWVRDLRTIHEEFSSEQLENLVLYLPLKQ